MRCCLSLIVLCAVLLFAHTIQGQSLITAGSMPSADRIFSEIKGKDPMDTAARQMGAFWHLRQVVETLAGPRRFSNQLTVEERGLLGAYGSGYQKAGAPYAKLMGTPGQPKWYQMHAFYEADDGFRDEVLERFVTPAIRDAYLRATGIQLKQAVARGEAAQRERERVQAELKAGGPGSAANPQHREEQALQAVLDTLLKGAAELAKTREAGSSTEVRASSPAGKASKDEFDKGKARWDAKDYPTAISHFKKSIAHEPSSAAYHMLGRAQYDSKAYPAALDAFTQVTRMVPTNAPTLYWIGKTHLELKQYPEAERAFRDSVRLKPDTTALINLGIALVRQRKYEDALEPILQATRLGPGEVDTWIALGYGYLNVKRPQDAMQAYHRAAAIDKVAAKDLLARVHVELSIGLVERGDVEDALKSVQEAVRVDPKDDGIRVTLSWVYLNMGRKEDAVLIHRALEKAGSAKAKEVGEHLNSYFPDFVKDDPESLLTLAIAAHAGGQKLQPLATYRRILLQSKDPEQRAHAHRMMGEVYAEQRNAAKARQSYEEALTEYQLAIRANPQDADLKWMLGRCYLELGRRDEALNVHKRLLPVDKDKAQKLLDEINKKK